MYLSKKTYVKNWSSDKPEERKKITVLEGGRPMSGTKPERVSYIIEEMAYWRKANAIHNWFVTNVQNGKDDCDEYRVSKKQLEALRDACRTVIEGSPKKAGAVNIGESWSKKEGHRINFKAGTIVADTAVAERLLPTLSGFFFGNTDYDEMYLSNIKDTEVKLTEILEEPGGGDYYYSSSW